VASTSAGSYLTVYPNGQTPRPTASSLVTLRPHASRARAALARDLDDSVLAR